MTFTLPENLTKEELVLVVQNALQQLHDRCGGASAVLSVLGSTLTAVTAQAASPAKLDKPLAKWQHAIRLINNQELPDPFLARGIHRLAIQRCVRHRWDPDIENWRIDDVLVKIESKPFAAGAMRECFAMKKLSTFYTPAEQQWVRAPNCVAKRYKKAVADDVYFDDVRLQMDSKALGELYNKTDPPKKVDFVQSYVILFPDKEDRGIYTVEHLIEGDYVKYNSNSGFVLGGDSAARNTPQSFSHFTYEATRGQKLCADIQGVGDLFTDPQLHTIDGKAYGDGNLGIRGMALFFRSHECNPLCQRLRLNPFIRCPADVEAAEEMSTGSKSQGKTVSRAYRKSSMIRRTVELNRAASVETPPGAFDSREHKRLVESIPLSMPDLYARVHLEVSRMACEVVAIPELYEPAQVESARQSALFHLLKAAQGGLPLAVVMMAKVHGGLSPCSSMVANMVNVCMQHGELGRDDELSVMYIEVAAHHGVRGAAASLAAAYHGTSELSHVVGFGSIQEGVDDAEEEQEEEDGRTPTAARREGLAAALFWYDTALEPGTLGVDVEEEASTLPGAGKPSYELLAAKAELLMRGGPGLLPDPATAAECLYQAAQQATDGRRGKRAAQFFELAAKAEGMVGEEQGDAS